MLVRSAGRRQRRHTSQLLAASFAQLQLPWLAPAQLRWSASQTVSTWASHRRRRVNALRPARAKPQVRHLATAADQQPVAPSPQFPPPGYSTGFKNSADENVPWDFSPKPQRDGQPPLSSLRPYDDPIIINSTTQDPAKLIKVQHGIYGDSSDLLLHLHTNLRIGRFNRVEAIIQRLSEQSTPFAPELVHAHTAYLEEHLKRLASQEKGSSESASILEAMQRWIKVEVRSKGIDPSAKMLVVMIRAALRALDGEDRVRSIKRYCDWAETLGNDTLETVLDSEDYDDNEYTLLGPITAEYYEDDRFDHEVLATEAAKSHVALEQSHQFQPQRDHVNLDDLPDVMSTPQKGAGLRGIKRAMETFIDLPQKPADAPLEEQRARAFERQRKLEESSVDIAIKRWREADEELRRIGIHTGMQSKPMGAMMWQWYRALLPALEEEAVEVKRVLAQHQGKKLDERHHYGPFLESLPLDKVAASTILWVIGKFARGKNRDTGYYESEARLNSLTTGLGKEIEAEVIAEASKRRLKENKQANGQESRRLRRKTRTKLSRRTATGLSSQERTELSKVVEYGDMTWPLAPKVKLGAMLIQKLIETAQMPVTREHPRTKEKITQMQPAFLHRIKYVLGKKIGVVTPNPALIEKMESEPLGTLIAKRMPMVVEPKPWSGWNNGGYLHYPTPILRLAPGDKSGKDYFLAADNQGDLGQVYAGVTALGKVPWKVHPNVLKVQIEAWNSGEEIANFAPLHPQMTIPPEPDASGDASARRNWLTQLRDLENKRAGLHSKRCFQNFQLEIARSVVNETLYFPHNMDFRGRAYPIPPYLNHMGADNVRGLLVFAEGKELGDTGLRWLKIHLATVAGHDKASLEERVRFTEEHKDDIYDSARNPLGGRRWWLEAEDAWQTLAACFELTQALDSPNPTEFVSTIPIQQDGTCNGLQHYAALGGDQIGARQVNLEPGDRPADVYTAVAEAVKEEVAKDAAAGNPIAQKLNGHLTRKCVKQPVMTNVYGVTFFGAKQQVEKQLEVLFPDVSRSDPVNLRHMSLYVATKIFKSLGHMFSGAQAIQHWLGQCADRIATCLTPEQIKQLTDPKAMTELSKPKKPRGGGAVGHARAKRGAQTVGEKTAGEEVAGGKSTAEAGDRSKGGSVSRDMRMSNEAKPLFRSTVVWTTPLRLPVVQPYRKSKAIEVRTNLQMLHLQEPQVWDPVSKRKQLQAFPPNFIHSLDATHMLLSALKCNEVGMTFASIHDSFWTHACDVNRLSTLLRDAFVEMHSENIIGRLREEFQTRYKGCMYLASVVAKSKVGVRITEWRKQHKEAAGKSGELAVEAERMRLLNNEDDKEREKGAAMVTPGSIMASEGDPNSLVAPTEMAGQALGDMPDNVDYEATNSDADVVSDTIDESEAAEVSEGVVSGSVLDTDTDALAEAGSEIGKPADEAGEKIVQYPSLKGKAKGKVYPRKTYVWLPMTFPEVPPKGGFDVTRLRASKYFFH